MYLSSVNQLYVTNFQNLVYIWLSFLSDNPIKLFSRTGGTGTHAEMIQESSQ